jgi:hypothetical protein
MTRQKKLKEAFSVKSISHSILPVNLAGEKIASTHSGDDLRGKLLDVSDSFRQSLWSLYKRLRIEQGDNKVVFSLEDKTLETNLNLFLSQIDLYERTFNTDATHLIERTFMEGPLLAKSLKKQLQSGFLRYHGTPHLKESLKEFDDIEQTKYHQVFPFDHLPYWKDSEVDDYKYYFTNPTHLSVDSEDKFKTAFSKLLATYVKSDIKPPSELDILAAMKTTTILSKKYKFHAEERIRHPYLGNKTPRLRGRRAVIFVGPANERDSVVWDLESQEWISKAHLLTMQILDQLPMSAMAQTVEKQTDREDDVKRFRNGYLHYVRDIKKCGLTMNVRLFILIKEVLEDYYPNRDFSCIDAYRDISITSDINDKEYNLVKGDDFVPLTGHGLGSANSLTTLVQCILFQIRSDHLKLDWNLYKSISWNDDLLETIHCDHAHKIYNLDLMICEEFGLEVKKTHTGLLRGGHVFCEEYESLRNFDCDKSIKTLLSINKQRFAPNIYCAKSAIRSLIDIDMSDFEIEKELSSLINHWGYEFFPEESSLPSLFGGWKDFAVLNIDTSLEVLEDLDEDLTYGLLKRAFDAEQISISKFPTKRTKRRMSDLPERGKLWSGGVYVKDGKSNLDGLELDLIGWHPQELLKQFQGSLGLRYYPATYWRDILVKRRKAFLNKENTSHLSEVELINYITNKAYPKYFSLPREYVKEWSTRVTLEPPLRSIGVPGYSNMMQEDQINLLANVCKQHSTAEVSCRLVDQSLINLKVLDLQGHILSVAFDKRYPMYRSEEIDEQLYYYTPIPLLLETYYYAKYASIPKALYEGIKLPRVDFEINVAGFDIPRDIYVSRSSDQIRSIRIAIAVLLCTRVKRELIGSLLKQALKDNSITTMICNPRISEIFLDYLETGDSTRLQEAIDRESTVSVLTAHGAQTEVVDVPDEPLVMSSREDECPVCMNENFKIDPDDIVMILSCCGQHIPKEIGHTNDANELVGSIEELWNLEDDESEGEEIEIWDPGGNESLALDEYLIPSDEEIMMSDLESYGSSDDSDCDSLADDG